MSDVAATAAEPSTLPLDRQLEQYRRELIGYYRMLGSGFEAEDAVQETMVRAWKAYDRSRAAPRCAPGCIRIATNVCLDMLGSKQRRARPMDFGAPRSPSGPRSDARSEATWIEPIPDGRASPTTTPARSLLRRSDPAGLHRRLQHLPPEAARGADPHEVLRWKAEEAGNARDDRGLGESSALQRARATLVSPGIDETDRRAPRTTRAACRRYADAFERYDIEALTALLHDDATLSMPPYDLWLQGEREIARWLLGRAPSARLADGPVEANGSPAFGQYRPLRPAAFDRGRDGAGDADGKVTGINSFLDTERLFPLFGLPPHLD